MMPKEFNNRVLVIDDEDVVRVSMREILAPRRRAHEQLEAAAAALFGDAAPAMARSSTTFDFEVEEATTGREGLDRLIAARERGRPFALAFVDVRMPGWDGVETAEQIRAVDREVEIVFVTAYSDYDMAEVIARVGANVGYHCKPFAPEEIRQIATKAAHDWNKLRSLESLISVVAELGAGRDELEVLFDNVLHQVTEWTGTRSAAVLHCIGTHIEPVAAVGELQQPDQLAPALARIAQRGRPGAMWREDPWLGFALGDYVVVARLDADTQLHTDRLYLVRLLLEQAGRAVENSRLHEQLLRAQTLSKVGVAMSQVIHDLRQPLLIIDGMLSVARMAEDDVEREAAHAWIKEASLDMQGYVDSILSFVRNEGVEREPTDVVALLERIRGRAEVMFRDDPTRVEVAVSGPLTADLAPSKIQRTVLNLCKNAVEALRDAGRSDGRVMVVAYAEGESLVLRIEDNGPGVPSRIEHTLFEPFVTFGKRRGAGLGLAIAAQICESHGGTIELSSSPSGARFTMRLPLRAKPAPA